jgi:hypothetical protein
MFYAVNPAFLVYLLCLLWGGLLGWFTRVPENERPVLVLMFFSAASIVLWGTMFHVSLLGQLALCGALLGGAIAASSGSTD